MAAHYWQLLFLFELGCAAASAEWFDHAWGAPLLVLAMIGLAAFLLLPAALIGVSLVITRRARATQSGNDSFERLRAWLIESLALSRAALAMSLEPWRHFEYGKLPVGATPQLANPVLLIHGVICNRAVWRPLAGALRSHGFGPIHAVNLEPIWADIDTHAAFVANEIRRLRREYSGARVTVVAHSMGGLAVRAALRLLGPEDIPQIITLGTPHHGSVLARLLPGSPHRQMRPDSGWLAALNAAQEGHLPVPFTCIYSVHDNLVVPARSAALAGASRFELKGLGHLSLLSAPAAIDSTLTALTASPPGGEPCLT